MHAVVWVQECCGYFKGEFGYCEERWTIGEIVTEVAISGSISGKNRAVSGRNMSRNVSGLHEPCRPMFEEAI